MRMKFGNIVLKWRSSFRIPFVARSRLVGRCQEGTWSDWQRGEPANGRRSAFRHLSRWSQDGRSQEVGHFTNFSYNFFESFVHLFTRFVKRHLFYYLCDFLNVDTVLRAVIGNSQIFEIVFKIIFIWFRLVQSLLIGDEAKNRWFDKCFQLIVDGMFLLVPFFRQLLWWMCNHHSVDILWLW